MIHYTCDRCRRQIDTEQQARYVVQIEIQSVADDGLLVGQDDEVDQLSELHQTLEAMNVPIDDDDHELNHCGRYDLCADCHRQFMQNPLGRDAMVALGFSNN